MMKNTAKNEIDETWVEPTLTSPGALLSRARKDKGLSLDDMVTHLGLPRRVLSALEEDEYERLPTPMYVRGYVRRYCALLELADTPVLELVEQQFAAQGIEDHRPSLRLPTAPKKKIRPTVFIVPLLVVLLVVAAAFVWAMQSNNGTHVLALEPSQTASAPALAMTALSNTSGNELDVAEPDQRAAGMSEEGGDEGMRTLSIRVVQQSWVEVFDAEGDMLVADLKPSGSELEVTGRAPFSVTLGYAPGVEISYGGQTVPVTKIAGDNTATLKIGDEYAEER